MPDLLETEPLRHTTSPAIAILVPAYRNETTIRETVDSVLRQDAISQVKWIEVCEDAGGDSTHLIAEAACGETQTIRVHRNDRNLGEAGNVMSAVGRLPSEVEWILFMHGDDYAYPDWVSRTLEAICAAPAEVAVIGSSYDVISSSGDIISHGEGRDDNLELRTYIGPASIAGIFTHGSWWHISGGAVRRSVWSELGGRDNAMPLLGDADFLVRAFERGYGVTYIPRPLTAYRISTTSVSAYAFDSLRDVSEHMSLAERYHKYIPLRLLFSFEKRLLTRCCRYLAKQALRRDTTNLKHGTAVLVRLFRHFVVVSARLLKWDSSTVTAKCSR